MANPLGRLMVRAAVPKAGLGNLITQPKSAGKGRVTAGTQSITYVSEGQPLNVDFNAESLAFDGYDNSVYVRRCVRLIGETIAGLPWVAGNDPTVPGDYNKDAPLAVMLGPATPQAPGGPNPVTSARAMWIWSIVQYMITGRFAWECQLDGPPKNREIVGLWPLVSAAVAPKPTLGGTSWFNGYEYTTALGVKELTEEQVVYCWRQSAHDWRLPESPLSAATMPIYISTAINRYMANFLKNGLVATTMVVSPPFEEASARRAWQDQFLSEFTGVDRAGNTIFSEMDMDDEDNGKPYVQVERLATTPIDAGLTSTQLDANNDICIALGVPRSLIGDASQRTYANADSEYKNFWTLTVLNLLEELQDHVNMNLAPRLGQEAGWFDLSRVAALQPPSIFAPPAITDVISTGVANAAQIANVLGIPSADATGDSDTDTVDIGEESSSPSPTGKASADMSDLERREYFRSQDEHRALQARKAQERGRKAAEMAQSNPTLLRWLEEADRRRHEPINTHTLKADYRRAHWKPMERERIVLRPQLSTRGAGIQTAATIIDQMDNMRSLVRSNKKAEKVHAKLSTTYPQNTLRWVKNADWTGPQEIPLSEIQMDRRPGGRDQEKVTGIAKGIADNPDGHAAAPVVLVKTPGSGKLKVADGYHRTLAHKRLGHDTVPAYVGEVDDENGPWDRQMHDAKMNRAMEGITPREEQELELLGDILALEVV
jgi:HK97 family phage portal protein